MFTASRARGGKQRVRCHLIIADLSTQSGIWYDLFCTVLKLGCDSISMSQLAGRWPVGFSKEDDDDTRTLLGGAVSAA